MRLYTTHPDRNFSPDLKRQVGAELCQAQVKLEVVDEVVAKVGCRDCS